MTAVAPLAAGGSSAAWSVDGGNYQIAEKILDSQDIYVKLGHQVTAVKKSGNKFAVEYIFENQKSSSEFDFVVISTPIVGSGIDISDISSQSNIQAANSVSY